MKTYTTRDEAIYRDIIQPIEATDEDLASEYNIDAIADEIIIQTQDGTSISYLADVTPDEFWAIVQSHAL